MEIDSMSGGISIGLWTFVGAALGPVAAVLALGMRRFVAFMDGKEERPRPFKAWCIALAIVGALVGSMWQGLGFSECREAGYKVGECLILQASARP
ncbi:hypothetical protein [Stenotrophomonas sp.]|uniref:hypothetical protein n=1 Tax=Stenotrophomonas sp. TaxID=69392 RepID=UPI0028A20511|nr:hypothetical protein [Stenotrophomonas sp.]